MLYFLSLNLRALLKEWLSGRTSFLSMMKTCTKAAAEEEVIYSNGSDHKARESNASVSSLRRTSRVSVSETDLERRTGGFQCQCKCLRCQWFDQIAVSSSSFCSPVYSTDVILLIGPILHFTLVSLHQFFISKWSLLLKFYMHNEKHIMNLSVLFYIN